MKLRYTHFAYRSLTLVLWIVVAYSLYFHHLATPQTQMDQNPVEEMAMDDVLPSTDEFTIEQTTTRVPSVQEDTMTTISEVRSSRVGPVLAPNSDSQPTKKFTPIQLAIRPISNRSVIPSPVTVKAIKANHYTPGPAKSKSVKDVSKNSMDEYNNMGGIVVKRSNASMPINPHPFHYILNPHKTCNVGSSSNLFLLVYVHTRPDSIKQREQIRSTWGNVSNYAVTVRLIFVMGLPENDYVQDAVKLESKFYRDILQENFRDTYRNLTYKAIGALKWVKQYCNQTKFVLKTDDDAFVNMHVLLDLLVSKHKSGAYGPRSLICNVWYESKVPRKGKWAVSVAQRKHPYWPTFCQGIAYIMTPGVAADLYEASFNVPFLWMDDVYVTGFLARKLKLVHTQIAQHFVVPERIEKFVTNKALSRKVLFSHLHNFDQRKRAWDKVMKLLYKPVKPKTVT